MGDPTPMRHQATKVWIHSLSAIFGSLIDAGLTITMFREHEVLPWRRYAAQVAVGLGETISLSGYVESLVPVTDRMWRLRDGHPRMALPFSIGQESRPEPTRARVAGGPIPLGLAAFRMPRSSSVASSLAVRGEGPSAGHSGRALGSLI